MTEPEPETMMHIKLNHKILGEQGIMEWIEKQMEVTCKRQNARAYLFGMLAGGCLLNLIYGVLVWLM